MADDSKKFTVILETKSEGDGAAKAAADLDKQTGKVKEATAAIKEYTAAQNDSAAAQREQDARNAGNQGKGTSGLATDPAELNRALAAEQQELAGINAAEERRNAIMRQRETIIATETEALAAEAAGDRAHAAALEREILIMREGLRLQQQMNVSEAEAMAIATERVVAMEVIEASKRRQAVAEAEQAAANKVALAAERQKTIEMEKQAAASGALMRSLASTAGGKLGVAGVGGALVGGLGGLGLVVGMDLAIQALMKTFGDAKGQGDAAAKAAEGAAKAETDRVAALAKAIETAMKDAGIEAGSLVKALDEVISKAVKGMQAIDAMEAAKAKNKIAGLDEAEQLALAGETTEEGKARVSADFAAKRLAAKQQAETEAAVRARDLAKSNAGQALNAIASIDDEDAGAVAAAKQKAFDAAQAAATQAAAARAAAEKELAESMASDDPESGVVSERTRAASGRLGQAEAADKARQMDATDAQQQAAAAGERAKALAAAREKLVEQRTAALQAEQIAEIELDSTRKRQAAEAAKLESESGKAIGQAAASERDAAKKKEEHAKKLAEEQKKKEAAEFKKAAEGGIDATLDITEGILAGEKGAGAAEKARKKAALDAENNKRAGRGRPALSEKEFERLNDRRNRSKADAEKRNTTGFEDAFGDGGDGLGEAANKQSQAAAATAQAAQGVAAASDQQLAANQLLAAAVAKAMQDAATALALAKQTAADQKSLNV